MERLKYIRESKGFVQKDVSTYLGVDRTTYAKYETGASEPSIQMILKIAKFFSVTTDYLFGYDSDTGSISVQQDFSPEELELIDIFRSMNSEGQKWILDCFDSAKNNPKFIKPSATSKAI